MRPRSGCRRCGSLWQDSLAAFNAVLDAKTPIERRVFARRLPHPDHACFGLDDEHLAAVTQFEAIDAAIETDEGRTENEQIEVLVLETYHAIVDRIIAVPAETILGLLLW